ncbi:MAG: hypothetical protein GY778_19530, partial [bacterium]|nr:hypothetical protein [bacterium]
LYNAFVKRPPLTEFERFLPQETESFSLSGSADLVAFYDYLEDTVRACGPEAEGLLEQWAGIQEQAGFNVKKDLLSWINGEFVSVGFKHNGTDASVLLMKVNDEAMAREKIDAGLAWVAEIMPQITAQNPMLAMLGLRTTPTTHPELEGFTNVFIGMQPMPFVLGVRDGYIMGGSSADALALCLNTAAGKHPNIRKNDRVMAEALVPDGPCSAVTFSDLRSLGQDLAMVTGVISMVGGMAAMAVPPDIQPIVAKVMGIVAKLGPVVAKIDFYKSTATLAQFDGKAYHIKYATNYASPAERAGR